VYVDGDPLYPFGHGHSYTTFEYGTATATRDQLPPAGEVSVEINVTNAGERSGYEVVQCYGHQATPSLARPVQELLGFERVHLDASETATVTSTVAAAQFAYHGREMEYRVEPGEYELRIRRSAADFRSTADIEITGERHTVARDGRVYLADTAVERRS
jgi:beta-glucosidase